MSMVSEIARNPETRGLPISGIGGIETWSDAAQYIALGCGTVQVCTAAMVYGFKIVEEMKAGLEMWMDEKGYSSIEDFRGQAIPKVTDWQHLNLNYVVKAQIDQESCIKCGRCHIACEDTSHQAITNMVNGVRHFEVKEEGMRRLQPLRRRLPRRELHHHGREAGRLCRSAHGHRGQGFRTWKEHPNNPMAKGAIETAKVAEAKSICAHHYEMDHEPAE